MIDIMNRFLKDEVSYQEMYEEILNFIESVHIRNGEFEGNYYILKKMDVNNFLIFAENIYPDDGHREIPYSLSVYKNVLIKNIQEYAKKIGLNVK